MGKHRFAALLTMVAAALVLVFPSANPAWAVGNVTSNSTSNLTLDGIEPTVGVTGYKVIEPNWDDASHSPRDPQWKWASAVRDWVQSNDPSNEPYIGADGAVTENFANIKETQKKDFFDSLAAALEKGDIKLSPAFNKQGGNIGPVTMGEYIVVIEDSADYIYGTYAVAIEPAFNESEGIWQLNAATAINPKRQELPFEKSHEDGQDTGEHKIGDELSFVLKATAPNYPQDATHKEFYIGDKLSVGLTLNPATIKVYGVKSGSESLINAGEYELVTEGAQAPTDQSPLSFLVKFDDASRLSAYDKVHVKYTATLNEHALIGPEGNVNTGYEFWRDPYNGKWHDTDDLTTDFSFGIRVFKKDKADEQVMLSGAEFKLAVKDGATLKFIKEGDGVYRLAKEGESNATETLVVGAGKDVKGKLVLNGLAAGTYTLTETKAPDDYNIGSPTDITITAVKGQDGEYTGHVEGETEHGYVDADVLNGKGFQLPTTGGMGTAMFAAVGVVLVGGGAALYHNIRKREQR